MGSGLMSFSGNACRLQHPEGVDSASCATVSVSASPPTPVPEATGPQSPVLLRLVGHGTPPYTPPQPIVSQRDPLGLCDPPRIASPRTSNVIGQRWKTKKGYLPATRDWEEAEMLPGAKPVDSPQEFDCYGRQVPRPREFYYPSPHHLGREICWNLGPWEVQEDRGEPLRPLPGKEAKAQPRPSSRVARDR